MASTVRSRRFRISISAPAGKVTQAPSGGGYLLSHQVNDAFVAVNRLLKANEEVYWLKSATTANGKQYPVGTMYIPAKASTLPILQKVAADKGVSFDAVASKPAGDSMRLKPVRIGLWDQYGGSMPSGWTRWIFEQYEFPFEVVFPQTLDAGNLNSKFDVLVFVDGGIPDAMAAAVAEAAASAVQPAAESIPAEFRGWLGRVTVAKTVPELKKFVENGGTILTIGSSTALGYHFGLPIRDALVETVNGTARPLPREKYYVPGSILEARIDNTHPLAYGMDERAMVFYDESPAFRLHARGGARRACRPIAWYDNATPLRSGWAWGQQYLDQAVSIIEAPVGKGRVVLFGNEIAWRAQPHGTFKLLFNGIYYGAAMSNGPAVRTTEAAQR